MVSNPPMRVWWHEGGAPHQWYDSERLSNKRAVEIATCLALRDRVKTVEILPANAAPAMESIIEMSSRKSKGD